MQAKEAYADLKQSAVAPSSDCYVAFIAVCSRCKDIKAAEEAWEDMQASGVSVDAAAYDAMLGAFAKASDLVLGLRLHASSSHLS